MLIWPATKFVAGEDEEGAFDRLRTLNEMGASGMIDELGEHVDEREDAVEATNDYLSVLEEIKERGLDGCVSVKPTHLGLEIDEGLCRENLKELARKADELGLFLWVDMESSQHTDETIRMYEELLEETKQVGLCIQCYLRRSMEDIEQLVEKGGMVRLVKGAYDEPADVAFQEKEQVDVHFRKMMEFLFKNEARFAVATHDKELVEEARELYERYDPEQFEFQFLMGLRDDLKEGLIDEGYDVAEYIPYGDDWMAYYWRRVMERKENLFFALKALVGR